MAMDNSTINKIIKRINFDLISKFELTATKELSFVPVNMQKDVSTNQEVFFIAVCKNSDLNKIKEYAKTIIDNPVNFIKMSSEDFELLYSSFSKKYVEELGDDTSLDDFLQDENSNQEEQTSNDADDELLLQDDEEDDLIISDEEELTISDEEEKSEQTLEQSAEDEKSDEGDLYLNDSDDEDKDEIQETSENPEEDDDVKLSFASDDESNSSEDETYLDDEDDDFDLDDEDEEDYGEDGKPTADISLVKAPETKKLGEILLEENLITERQLEIALSEGKAQGIPLGSVLVKLGFVTMRDLKEALGAQMGLKYATAEQLKSLPTEISILPEDFIRLNKVIPLSMTDKSLVVGMVNPHDKKVLNEIVYQTGLKPTIVLVTHVEFENFLSTYYGSDRDDTDELLQKIHEDESFIANKDELQDQAQQEIEDSDGAVSQLANKIITMAIDRRASDIHIEPLNVGYRVRMRIDGSLQEALKIPAKVDSALISRFKVLSKMNIAEHRRAQDGSFTLKYKDRAQDFRVNTLPVAGREKMVIRVLAPQMDSKQAKADKIEVVGASEDDLKKMRYLVSAPNGIVLTAGPTGSGKTTTLYSLLRYMNSDDVNITTIEDPVEIKLEGINQSAINTKAGITFANSLRAILRQDPDTILIGEIRDYETLEVAISASLTGHLVLSTIHTNSAAATITRLIEMGAKDYLISSTVSGIIAQRLVKKLCPNCKKEYYPTIEEARKILTDPVEVQKLTKTKLYKPHGCPGCKNSGYLGRLAVLEILVVNNEIRKMIAQRAHDVELEDYAVKQGMKTLKMSCLRHILEGNTSIDEQVRILGLAASE